MMDERMLELHEMLARRCAFCERELREGEEMVLLPARLQERDALVREGLVERRVACVDCAMSLKQRSKAGRKDAQEVKRIVVFLRMLQEE